MKKLLVSLVAMLSAGVANASIVPTLEGPGVDIGGGIFRYTYSAMLASDQALRTGAYFTLYDIRGFAGFGNVGAGFTASSQLLGLTPSNVLPTDSAAFLNASFTYSGPDVNFSAPLSDRELGSFEILSTVGTVGFEDFTSLAFRNAGQARGSRVSTIGVDAVPVPGGGDGGGNPGTIPEPQSWALMMVGFGLVGATMRRRTGFKVTTA